jgi:ubiquitin-conjugating enzyme E2 J1
VPHTPCTRRLQALRGRTLFFSFFASAEQSGHSRNACVVTRRGTSGVCFEGIALLSLHFAAMSSDAVKRIMVEVRELAALEKSPDSFFTASPLESDLFEWHFTVRGPPETAFAAGLYHGRIVLPPEYPLKAPEIILLTPNGRFEVGTRICLSVTSHHNETWQPSWGIRTILTALVGFMPSKSEGLGALDYPAEDRRALARKSLSFECPRCGARPALQFPSAQESAKSAATAADTVSTEAAAEGISSEGATSSQGDAQLSDEHGAAAAPRDIGDDNVVHNRGEADAVTRDASAPGSGEPTSQQRRRQESSQQEKELLYLACAIAFAILAIIARRFVIAFE